MLAFGLPGGNAVKGKDQGIQSGIDRLGYGMKPKNAVTAHNSYPPGPCWCGFSFRIDERRLGARVSLPKEGPPSSQLRVVSLISLDHC